MDLFVVLGILTVLIFEQSSSPNPLALTAQEFVEEYTVIELFISTDADIRLPPAGVQLNADFGFASTAQNGPLPIDPPTLFESVAPIGSFLETCEFPCPLLREWRNRRKFSQCAPFVAVCRLCLDK